MSNRIGDRERAYVEEVLAAGFRSSSGSVMAGRLERLFAERFGVGFAITFVNGTATLHAALAAAGVGPGDEVVVPPLTMSSTTFGVMQTGAVPVFADVDPDTFTIDPMSVAANITDRTKAVIPVALYGLSSDLDPILDLAAHHELFVLDDAAQCVLGTYKGRLVGTIAHASSFSFQSSKHLTAGEGGMITTDDPELAAAIRRFGSLGYRAVAAAAGKGKITRDTIQDPDYERHADLGWNYRMPELCAAVLLAQVERMDELISKRCEVAKLFADAVADFAWLKPQRTPPHCTNTYWCFAVELDTGGAVTWHDFRNAFRGVGGDGVYAAWQLTYLEPVLRGRTLAEWQTQQFEPGLCPNAERLQRAMLQFKTNYMELDAARRQADLLHETAQRFDGP
ncbi:MAG: DegT/DnrJ/EryC1/StrS family aminotransferase [Actinomycetota bacterium]|nr:DegT/DnrJ/EryC1/StrS family aminotransferase [Actinomycetota bacterium]